jgi:two-component system LytT family sensor kinase
MSDDSALLVQLLVRIAVIASMASIVLRWSFAKRLFLREQRTFRQRLELGLVFGAVFAAGTGVRLVLRYDAAEVGLEGAFVSGLVGGYLPGAVAGSLIALPTILAPHKEWLALPLLAGVGALGGLLRDFAPGPEEIWRFSPFFPFTIPGWLLTRIRRLREHDVVTSGFPFQMVLFFTCLAIEFIRTSLGHTFGSRQWLFVLYSLQEPLNPVTVMLVYYSTVACVGLTLKVWNNTRIEWKLEEQRRLLMQARLDALTSQINPHFLFNTLNSVASLIRIDQETARHLIFKLSTILRRLLRKQEAFTTLREELAFIDDYLSIEVVRFGEKLRIVKEIDPQTLGALVPSMLLQPIVENSIKHGLSPKVDGGTIWLRSALRGGRLQLELEDDGVGIAPEAMPEIFQRGIGVSNVHERLRVLFGNEFVMVIHHRPGGGTQVRVQIPELHDPGVSGSDERLASATPASPAQTVGAGRRD